MPKTIDNDVVGTDYTFGFDTAVQVATDAIDRLHTTAQSHDRVMVVEVMGRNSGWIAVFAGIAGGADGIVIPELELTVEELAASIKRRHERGKDFSIIVVAEGAELTFASGEKRVVRASDEIDDYGYPRLGGIGQALARELEERTGYETRVTTLGHVQRGGTPDRDRPHPRHALRGQGGRHGHGRRVRPHGRSPRREHDLDPARGRRRHQDRRPGLPRDGQDVLRMSPGTEPRRLFLLVYEYVEDMVERRAPFRDGHLALVAEWHADGRLVMAGGVGDPPAQGLLVFDVDDPAVVEEFVAADPYGPPGLVVSHRVEPWTVVAG